MDEIQRIYDKFLIEMAIGPNRPCWVAQQQFQDMYGDGLAIEGLQRVPPKSYAWNPVRAWLYQAYPQFIDAEHRCYQSGKPISNIRLEFLKFIDPKKPAQMSVPNSGVRHYRNRMQANSLQSKMIFDTQRNGYTPTRVSIKSK